ncbi:MAG TPA: S9 family peptidase [bacterium]|nr:S9 family peptidase [bacterium]
MKQPNPYRITNALLWIPVLICLGLTPAGGSDIGYRTPPPSLASLVDVPPTPAVSMDPGYEWMAVLQRPGMPSIRELAQPELRIGGLRLNPRTHGMSRPYRTHTGIHLQRIKDGSEYSFKGLPEIDRILESEWSPDGRYMALAVLTGDDVTLWLADTRTLEARQPVPYRLNTAYGSSIQWIDQKRLIIKKVPDNQGPEPEAPEIPIAPVIQETTGHSAPVRTYQDLLKNPHDEDLLEYYLLSELVRIHVDGNVTPLGEPGLIAGVSPSPDARFLLVQTIQRPFSYLVTVRSFPRRLAVWDMDGNEVKVIADLPLQENVPTGFEAVPTGPRSFQWRDDAPATLVWVEAMDQGDPRLQADIRDRIFTLQAPFTEPARPLADLALRYAGIRWGHGGLALISEYWWSTRKTRTWIIEPDNPEKEPGLLFDRSTEDAYSDPGNPVMKRKGNASVLLFSSDRSSIYLSGQGASPEGSFPFLDELNLKTGKTRRLWQSEAPYYERVVEVIDPLKTIITVRESADEPGNYYLRDMKKGRIKALTRFPNPYPQLQGMTQEMIRYERNDGVQLTATLYLPPGYRKEDGPLPMIMWAYPREYKSADAASQVTDSPYRFARISWSRPILWLAEGYAILDGPTMPIVGEGDSQPNDTFVEQLVASARAAVDEVVRRGVADPERIAVGGHSYGAFMTANLLAHSDLFAAGIARSGAYNRTLTPFGFQAEPRTFWEAPEVYFHMSPFMHADKVNEPILLIHGATDNNSGTFPLQSERYYHALKGHGATTRLVMLPFESHGYSARESIMHTLWEMNFWLEKYVKNRSDQ